MKIIESALKASTYIAEIKAKGKKIGFVPTLGGLHKGHQLLMQKAREQNDVTVISIFLNPMQFRKKHFIEYPSDFELDKVIAKKKRITLIFHPTIKEMFPFVRYLDDFFPFQNDEFKARDPERFVIEPKVQNSIDELIRVPNEMVYQLDGKLHPWFFDASATIVHKLFKILQPDHAYFGEKDIQQLAIITKMAETYFPAIKVIGIPTLRDADGLAFSSRNVKLSDKQRQSALKVYHALKYGENLIRKGESETRIVLTAMKKIIMAQHLLEIDYIDIVDKKSLKPVNQINNAVILYVAFFVNSIRLTDTLIINLMNEK
ncbi:MAG: pantoate--beta-alanine ligase [Gammaproteobacteria bacterium]|nr:MAG: pantoate--beta-alanine ligase [Gammaproteobacteria bacterium]RKZ77127.1 MAG: pantoate--beta-alanine ligase [Gammaproteobacteria bacterium]